MRGLECWWVKGLGLKGYLCGEMPIVLLIIGSKAKGLIFISVRPVRLSGFARLVLRCAILNMKQHFSSKIISPNGLSATVLLSVIARR